MRALKVEKAMLAFTFFIVDGKDSFDYLEDDVKQAGGTVERVSDNLAIIKIGGADYALPLGFAVIINGGVGKILSQEVFDNEYVCVVDTDELAMNNIAERLASIESKLADLSKLVSTTKSRGKVKDGDNNG